MRLPWSAFLVAVLVLFGCRTDRPEPVRVFAAASLTDVMEVLVDSFETREEGRYEVLVNVAGSSLLARQVMQGAQADLFISAHPGWTQYLSDARGLPPADTLPIANELVLVHRKGGMLTGGRVALADPEHVPAGMYAQDALVCEGLWAAMEDRVVPTLDVRAALGSVIEGAAESAVVYASDTLLVPGLEARKIISDRCRPEIVYTASLLTEGREGPSRFFSFLLDQNRRSTWERHGFGFRSSTNPSIAPPFSAQFHD